MKSTLNNHWNDWCWSFDILVTWLEELTHWKRPWCWERLMGGGEKGTTEDKIVGWHHWLSGHEFEETPEDSEGEGSLVCCNPWVVKSWTWLSDWQYRRRGFDSFRVRRIPWRGKWQLMPVFLPGKSHGQRSLADYSPWGHKELDTTERLNNRTNYR